MKRRTLDPKTHASLMDYWRYWEARGRDFAWVYTRTGKRPRFALRKES